MRADAPDILQHLGYVLDVDFVAIGTKDGAEIKWLSAQPQPDEKALDAAAPIAEAAKQAEETKRIESDTARTDAKQAYSDLEPLLTHKEPEIALLAGIMQKHLLATLGR